MKKLFLFTIFIGILFIGCDNKETPELSFSEVTIETTVGEEFTLSPTLKNSESLINYSFDKEGVIKVVNGNKFVSETVGEVKITAALIDFPDVKTIITVIVKEAAHTHVFDKEVASDKYLASPATESAKAKYYYSCECGEHNDETFEYGEVLPHTHVFDKEVIDDKYLASPATESAKAKYFYSCECGEHSDETFKYGEVLPHTHVFNKEVIDDKYLASPATESEKAKYYYSCECGEHNDETFEYGEVLPHTHVFDKEVIDDKYLASPATESAKAKYYYSCECGEHGDETFEYGEVLPKQDKTIEYVMNDGSWSWEVNTITTPKNGIDAVSNLPEIFMGDFYYYLLENDLLTSDKVYAEITAKAASWDSFSTLWTDPKAIYNNNSKGTYSTNDGYPQFFYDSVSSGVATGGFFGTSPYKEKYANLFSMLCTMTTIKYPTVTTENFKQTLAFVFDGYFYGTQGVLSSGDNYELFNFYRASIPTPTTGFDNNTVKENTYEITSFKDSIDLVAPVKEGYVFLGWYQTEDFQGEKVTTANTSMKLYAKWYDLNYKAPSYKINYDLDGGVNDSNAPTSYTLGTVTVLPEPTKTGFVFLGWEMNGVTGYVTEISNTQKEDVTIKAIWKVDDGSGTITYVYDCGELPTHKATSFEEFANTFWNELYAWSGSTETLTKFKDSNIAKWVTGNVGSVKVYLASGKDVIDNAYFINSKGNEKWMEWMKVFEAAVVAINGTQSAFASTYVGYTRLGTYFKQSASYWSEALVKSVYEAYPISTPLVTEFKSGSNTPLVNLVISDGRTFLGWFDANDNKVTNTKELTKSITLYAKWSSSTPIEDFSVTNKINKLERLSNYKLEWSFTPSNATNKNLVFVSSNPSIISIDEEGQMIAHKDGVVTITVKVVEDAKFNVSFEVTSYVNPFIDINFESTNVVEVGKSINVNTKVYGTGNVLLKSLDTSIATVDNKTIEAHSSGYVLIEAYLENNPDVKTTFGVTCLTTEDMNLYKVIIDSHNSDIHVTRDLSVAYDYNTDVYTSVSDILFNHEYEVNRDYEEAQSKVTKNHGGARTSTEFICVHYTANTGAGSGAAANASYFSGGQAAASIHYTTGNDGIYHVLDDSLVGFHAGDGTGTTFTWTNTKVMALSNVKPVWGVVANSSSATGYYFTINGTATTIAVPTTGTTSSGATKTMTDPSKCFTYFGPAWKVVDGYYYIGTTWACFTQTLAGAISSKGGNNNSIGIETACNRTSDLWLTYQYTAELVARLMDTYKLDSTRVVGHNAFSGKDCPQTLLANNGELWEIFMECVEAEYELYTKMTKDGKYTISAKSDNTTLVKDDGRVIKIPNYTTVVSYTVTIKNNETGATKDLTFLSIIHGTYTE